MECSTDHPIEGLLRVLETDAPIEQIGGTLEIGVTANSVNLFGGAFQTASILTNEGVKLGHLDAGRATNRVIIRPGGENSLGRITAEKGITLNSNVTMRLDIASISIPGLSLSNHDLIDLADTGEMRINDARLELNDSGPWHA